MWTVNSLLVKCVCGDSWHPDCFPVSLLLQVQQLTATVILLAIVLLLCPLSSSFSELAAFSAAYGLVYGATVAIHITVLAEVVGVHRLGSALGFFMLIRSSGGLLGPPIAGVWEICFDEKPSKLCYVYQKWIFQSWVVVVKVSMIYPTKLTTRNQKQNQKE